MGLLFKYNSFFLAVLLLTSWTPCLGASIRIDISPQVYNGITSRDVNVTCSPSQTDSSVEDIMVMEVSKDGGKPLVFLRQGSVIALSHGVDTRYEATGFLDHDVSNSYLQLSLTNPKKSDTGVFSCIMYYLDQSGLLQDGRARGNLTVEDHESSSAVTTYLMDKVHLLEQRLAAQEKENENQKMTIAHQQGQLFSQNNVINDQENALGKLENRVHNQEILLSNNTTNNIQESRILLVENKLKDQEIRGSFMSAFSAGYNTKDTFAIGDTLVFSDTIFNIGQDYNTTTGIFKAPRRGLYAFHLAVTTRFAGGQLSIDLRANGRLLVTLQALDKSFKDQSSVSTAVSLQTGDQVTPEVRGVSGTDNVFAEEHFSVFTGYLIKLL